jgi:cell division protein FtsB
MDSNSKILELEKKIDSLQREVDDLYQENLNIVNLIYELRQKIDLIESQNQYETLQTSPVVDSPRTVTFTEQDFI